MLFQGSQHLIWLFNCFQRWFAGYLNDSDDESLIEDRRGYYIPQRPPPTGPGSHPGQQPYPSQQQESGPSGSRRNPLRTVYGWTEIDFTWPSPQRRREAIASGAFQSHNIIPLDMEVFEHDGNSAGQSLCSRRSLREERGEDLSTFKTKGCELVLQVSARCS